MNASITKEFNAGKKDLPAGRNVLTLSITADDSSNVNLDGSISTGTVTIDFVGEMVGAALANLMSGEDAKEMDRFIDGIKWSYWKTLKELVEEDV